MKTFVININPKHTKVTAAYETQHESDQHVLDAKRDKDFLVTVNSEETLRAALSLAVLGELYNSTQPEDKQIKHFSDKKSGARRTWAALNETKKAKKSGGKVGRQTYIRQRLEEGKSLTIKTLVAELIEKGYETEDKKARGNLLLAVSILNNAKKQKEPMNVKREGETLHNQPSS